jgi:hypothetical protein
VPRRALLVTSNSATALLLGYAARALLRDKRLHQHERTKCLLHVLLILNGQARPERDVRGVQARVCFASALFTLHIIVSLPLHGIAVCLQNTAFLRLASSQCLALCARDFWLG